MTPTMSYMAIPSAVLNKVISPNDRKNLVVNEVCNFYGTDRGMVLYSHSRKHELCICRHVITYILKFDANMSWRAIADFLGNKNHTSGIHSVNTINDWMETDDKIMSELTEIRMRLLAKLPPVNRRSVNAPIFLREKDLAPHGS